MAVVPCPDSPSSACRWLALRSSFQKPPRAEESCSAQGHAPPLGISSDPVWADRGQRLAPLPQGRRLSRAICPQLAQHCRFHSLLLILRTLLAKLPTRKSLSHTYLSEILTQGN